MAGLNLVSVGFVVSVLVVVTRANILGCPGLPWCKEWVACNYTETQGSTCLNETTKLICTPVGGIVIRCWFPGKENCVDGKCVRQPATTPEPETSSPSSETSSPSSETEQTPPSLCDETADPIACEPSTESNAEPSANPNESDNEPRLSHELSD